MKAVPLNGFFHKMLLFGPVAQRWSRGLIILWLSVRIRPGPPPPKFLSTRYACVFMRPCATFAEILLGVLLCVGAAFKLALTQKQKQGAANATPLKYL